MKDHIYGCHPITLKDRPHVFLNELQLYVEYLKKTTKTSTDDVKKLRFIKKFRDELLRGISYYRTIVDDMEQFGHLKSQHFLSALDDYETQLQQIRS